MPLTQEQLAAAKSKPLNERTVDEKNAVAYADVMEHTARTNPSAEEIAAQQAEARRQRVQLERDNAAVQDWLLTEPRYNPDTESAAALWQALRRKGLPCTVQNLAEQFEWCLAHNLLKAKEVLVEKRPPTLKEWAAQKGITKDSIARTNSKRLRELCRDDNYRRAVELVANE